MKLSLILSLIAALISLQQCGSSAMRSIEQATVIARVGDDYLYLEDIHRQMPKQYKSEDSAQLTQSIVNQWVKEQLLLHAAKEQLPDSLQNFAKQIEVYRNNLLIHSFKQRWIASHIDTTVSNQEIESFYSSHQEEFLLKQNIVQFAYVKVPIVNKKEGDTLSYLIQNIMDTAIDRTQLEQYCLQKGYDHFLNTEQWIPLNELARQVPMELYNQETYLKNNRFVSIKDYPFWHILHITNFKIKDDISPLDFERLHIKKIIIQKRENDLLKQLSTDTYNRALENNKLEFY